VEGLQSRGNTATTFRSNASRLLSDAFRADADGGDWDATERAERDAEDGSTLLDAPAEGQEASREPVRAGVEPPKIEAVQDQAPQQHGDPSAYPDPTVTSAIGKQVGLCAWCASAL
jgi:hypothetical protein